MNKYENSTNTKSNKNNKKQNNVRINWNIKCGHCRVIEDGIAPKIMKTSDAIEYAQNKGLDLVEIGYDNVNKCVNAKVIDYGKYCYEQKRKEKAMKKAAKENTPDLKCVQFSITTDIADMNRQIEHAKQFISDGDRVKIIIRFRNRNECNKIDYAKTVMRNILSNFDNLAVLDSKPTVSGKELSCILRKV